MWIGATLTPSDPGFKIYIPIAEIRGSGADLRSQNSHPKRISKRISENLLADPKKDPDPDLKRIRIRIRIRIPKRIPKTDLKTDPKRIWVLSTLSWKWFSVFFGFFHKMWYVSVVSDKTFISSWLIIRAIQHCEVPATATHKTYKVRFSRTECYVTVL